MDTGRPVPQIQGQTFGPGRISAKFELVIAKLFVEVQQQVHTA